MGAAPKLLLELGLVVLDVLAKLFDLLRVALLPPGDENFSAELIGGIDPDEWVVSK